MQGRKHADGKGILQRIFNDFQAALTIQAAWND